MNFNVQVMIDTIWVVFGAVPRTFVIAVIILLFGIILGGVMAFVKMKRLPVLSQITNVFISYARGVPLIVRLLVVRASLPDGISALLGFFGFGIEPHELPNILIVLVTYIFLEAALQS